MFDSGSFLSKKYFMRRRNAGILYAALAASSYGTNPLFALPLFANGIGVNSVLFYRYAIAVILYSLWLKFVKKISLKISMNQIFPLIILGVLFSLSSLLLFDAFNYIDAGIACTILFVYPVLVALIMAIFFKEKTNATIIMSLILTTIGIIFLYQGDSASDLDIKGVLLVIISSLAYAIYIVGVQKIKVIKHIKSNVLSFYVMLFGLSVYVVNLNFCTQLQMISQPKLWLCTFGIALLPTVISLETITYAIKLVGPTKTALLGALEPVTALLIGVFVFNETITSRIWLGILLIIFGVTLIVLNNNKSALKH